MSRTKEIVTAVGTLACALGIGFVMQGTETASQRYGNKAPEPAPVPATAPVELAPQASAPARPEQQQVAILDVQDVTLTSALSQSAETVVKAVETAIKPEPKQVTAPVSSDMPVANACDITATAAAARAATVDLTVSAPCHSNQRVTVHHNGMFFTDKTDAGGELALTVPALAEQAVYIFAFQDGEGAVAQTALTDIVDYNRVVLQWRGTAGFELHAREFGAAYGEPGHIWRGTDGLSVSSLDSGTGGFLHSLGSTDVAEPHLTEIYTFPATMSGRNGQIDLSIEAEVTAENCGLEIEAQTLERDGNGRMRTQNLTLAVPGCDAIGDYLVLNNVLDDMKVAAR